MNGKTGILFAIVALAFAALACNAVTGGAGNPTAVVPANTDVPLNTHTPVVATTGDALFSDDFSTKQWGTGTDKDSAIEYASEALQMKVFRKNWFVWSPPNAETYKNVHMEVTVINNDSASTTAFGIICNKESGKNNFNYLAITPAGEYAIARATEGQSDLFLMNDDQWAKSDVISQNGSSYRVGADCGSDGTLTLYVAGQQIASASDTTYQGGGIALFTWSGQNATSADVTFDDFLMTQLP